MVEGKGAHFLPPFSVTVTVMLLKTGAAEKSGSSRAQAALLLVKLGIENRVVSTNKPKVPDWRRNYEKSKISSNVGINHAVPMTSRVPRMLGYLKMSPRSTIRL